MRVGIIRGDISGPIFLADLEQTSQTNFATEPAGQTRYLSRPTAITVGAMLAASIPANLVGTANIVFPLVINNGNHTLKIRAAGTDPYTSVVVPNATYANITDLVAVLNIAMVQTAFRAVAFAGPKLALQTTAKGAGVRIQIDSLAGGSTFSTPANLALVGATFTVLPSASYIAAVLPIGGPLDVSAATIRGSLGGGLLDNQVAAAADAIAPQFVETDVALKSFLVGDLRELLSPNYNPDTHRMPPLADGPAIVVVQDDGVTSFGDTLPTITNAQWNVPGAGQVTITGTGLAGVGAPNSEVEATKVKFILPTPASVEQFFIVGAGGTVSATSIVIPASKVPAGVGAGTRVQVQYTSLASNVFTLV